MRRKIFTRNYLLSALGFTLILLLAAGTFHQPALAGGNNPGQGPPEYEVSPPAVVIQIHPINGSQSIDDEVVEEILSQDYKQGEMKVSWHNNSGDRDEDLKFKAEDLELTGQGAESENSFGFTSLNNDSNTDNIIGAEHLKVDGESLDEEVTVLSADKESAEVSFEIDEDLFNSGWQDVEAGVYKGNINPSIDLPGNSEERLKAVVIVESVIDISVPDKMSMEIEEPVNDKSVSESWEIESNDSNINVQFESTGKPGDDANDELEVLEQYKEFFRYHVSEGDSSNNATFAPGDGTDWLNYAEGELKISYNSNPDEADRSWHEVESGKYGDTIKITVSAD